MSQHRRDFLKSLGLTAAGLGLTGLSAEAWAGDFQKKPFFTISLAEWSLHKTLFGGQLTNMEFPAKAKNDFGISAVEYVNQFFKDKATDQAYLKELKQRTSDLGVRNVLIMIDGEGHLGDLDATKRKQAVENHYKWVDAAKFLGCHSIRVNAHGGYSSNGQWITNVMKQVKNPYCGTLPDFGNFCIASEYGGGEGCKEEYDRYKGTQEMMAFAKGVSAKTHDFDESGNETKIDYLRIMKIVKNAGYRGFVGIEYEGSRLSEEEGIRATKKLLEKVGGMLS
jgi:sugar phosphate isomerase/epimerase